MSQAQRSRSIGVQTDRLGGEMMDWTFHAPHASMMNQILEPSEDGAVLGEDCIGLGS